MNKQSKKINKKSGVKVIKSAIKANVEKTEKGTGEIVDKEQPTLRPPQLCLNCGHELHGEYCSHCGQEHIEKGVPGGEMFREFLKDEFHFDFRIVRTILPMLFRPGFLTAEYVAGRRVRYSPPLRTYVFISVIMFALIAIQAKRSHIVQTGIPKAGTEAKTEAGKAGEHEGQKSKAPLNTDDIVIDYNALTQEHIKDSVLAEIRAARADTGRKASTFDKAMERGLEMVLEDKEKFLEVLLERAAQAMFLLMPIFALLLKLLYIRRKRQYMEHLVFALHSHSHAFLMFVLVLAGGLTHWAWLQPWLKWPLIAIPIYFFLAMKRYYGQSWGKTLAKYLLLLGGYAFILLAAGVAVLVASVVWF